jgi:hypothetical protein
MTAQDRNPGGSPVGRVAELPPLERMVIRGLRLWSLGADGQVRLQAELAARHGAPAARHLAEGFGELLQISVLHARRPLLGHALDCPCAGADECVFARFVSLAAEGAREDAILIASLLVRADLALVLAGRAEEIGLGLMRGSEPRIVH